MRWQGLDGLRGVLAIVVLLYHGGAQDALPGGIISMDVFFVLSGFLITGLLLAEQARTGTVSLRAFWTRRARRLLPAVLLLLLVVPVVWRLTADPAVAPKVRDDALATLAYVANWHNVWTGTSYFDVLAEPSPLVHMWSLAVEEQFYVVWPLVVLGLLRLGGRRLLLAVCVAGTLASAGAALWLSTHGASASRMYYGTDVRAQALLIGAGLAVVLSMWPAAFRDRRLVGRLGTGGALVLGVALVAVNGEDPGLYRGGMLVLASAAACLCLALVLLPETAPVRLLSVRPLAGLGRVSYGVYLWHWPVNLVLDHERTGWSGPGLFLLRFAGSIGIALLSYHLLEQPIRRGRMRLPRLRLAVPAAAGVTAAVIVAVGITPYTASRPAYADITDEQVPLPAAVDRRPASTPPAVDVPVVLYYGDSIAYEAQGPFLDILQASGPVSVVLRTFPATAVCDWLPDMQRRVPQARPDAVVVSFLGIPYRGCMKNRYGQPLLGDALAAKVEADTRAALGVLTAGGAQVYWSAPPPHRAFLPGVDTERLTAVLRRTVESHPRATWVDAGSGVAPAGRYVDTLPCLPGEPCRPGGSGDVRAPDRIHFCPVGNTSPDSEPPGRCDVWSSGAYRYALAQAAPVLAQLGRVVPTQVVLPPGGAPPVR